MAQSPTSDAPARGGMFAHFAGLLAAKLGYLRARLRLAGIEGREAALQAAIIVALAAGGLVAVAFGYLLLVLALVFLVARVFANEDAWLWVLLGAALLHFLGAALLVLLAKARLGTPFFPLTLEEFKKDQAWLKIATKPN